MEGCLSTLIKLLILAGLFVVGLVVGYMYYLGAFDPWLVRHAFNHFSQLKPEEAMKLVDPRVTPALAATDGAPVDGKWILWRGTITEAPPRGDYTQLTLLSSDASRRLVVVFFDKPLDQLDGRVNDEVEVLGQVKRTYVLVEDREGHRYPQVLALTIKKIGKPVEGEEPASSPSPSPSPSPSSAPRASAAAPPPSPSSRASPR